MLRSRQALRTEPLPEDVVTVPSPDEDASVADAVGPALLVVLDMLGPAERLAFVLHDLFGVPFEEVAGSSTTSTAAADDAGQPGPPEGTRDRPTGGRRARAAGGGPGVPGRGARR